MATVEQKPALITAEEFERRPGTDAVEELVRGRIVMSPPPNRIHGMICIETAFHIRLYLQQHPIGRVVGSDAVIIVRRDPDTVRGADLAYYSFERLPRDAPNVGYGPEIPELVFEVLSPSDRWKKAMVKVGEYLDAGVLAVVVLDPEERTAHVFGAEAEPTRLGPDDLLRFESILPGFEAVVGRFFE
jgi:Uma2 family endonuclease